MELILQPHPRQAPMAGVAIAAGAMIDETGGPLSFWFRLVAPAGQIRLPAPVTPRRADGLWRHTCFEVFAAAAGERAYREFNFSPSGEWAAYAFADYRTDMRALNGAAAVAARWSSAAGWLRLAGVVPGDWLPGVAAGAQLQLGFTAVIEDASGHLGYWAVHHAGVQPDFHRRESFVVAMSPGTAGESP
jgi:hypothetical protein